MLREKHGKRILDRRGCLTGELKEIIDDSITDDEIKFDMHLLRGNYELKQLNGYSITSVIDTVTKDGKKGNLISFKKPTEDGCSCINLSLSGDGNIYISDAF